MATYYHGAPEIQPDGLQTLYLMNPGYVGGYSDSPAPANMVFLNSTINSLNPITLSSPHHPNHHHHHQQFVGIPLQPPGPAHDSDRPPPIQPVTHDLSAIHGLSPRLGYNLWTPPPPAASSNPVELPSPAAQLGPRRPAAAAAPAQQGLSLSLSPQQAPFVPYLAEPEMSPAGGCGEEAKVPAGVVGMQSVLMGSKYLKAAQQLLDEVVSVKGIKGEPARKGTGPKSPAKSGMESEGGVEGDTSSKRGVELTTAERQELQMKKAKLVNMLDEVEQRYRQYHHQMQVVVSSFEAVAGFGSARTYTALALHTISKQFRCLKDAISGQIRATSRSLGEEDCLAGGAKSVGSRLRFVDHQLRQQRALQQLGMIQHNAWRPQRGLPERAVSVLRAWLFEHFLHPYPKDSDKHMLAKQTGLTRSQVSNWFINARVRLWKPMVEEMYTEETKDQEPNKGDEKASKSEASEHSGSKSSSLQANSPTRTEQTDSRNDPKPPPITIPSAALAKFHAQGDESIMQQRLKKARSDESLPNPISLDMKPDELSNRELLMKFMDGRSGSQHGYNLVAEAASHGGRFAAYPIGEIGRFNPEQFTANGFGGNGVSLTLGLPHCEPFSQPSYLSNDSIQLGRRIEMSTEASDYFGLNSSSSNNNSGNAAASHPPNAYETINMQSRKRFAAQLLPDFVA